MFESWTISGRNLKKLSKRVPCNVSPDGHFYMFNNHHFVRSMWEANIDDSEKWVIARVINNWQKAKSLNDFYRALWQVDMIWPYDNRGQGPLDPRLLPSHISELLDDPFRSLASKVSFPSFSFFVIFTRSDPLLENRHKIEALSTI